MEILLTTVEPNFAARLETYTKGVVQNNLKKTVPHELKCYNCFNNILRTFWIIGERHPVIDTIPKEFLTLQKCEQTVKGKLINGEPYVISNGEILSLQDIPNLISAALKISRLEAVEGMISSLHSVMSSGGNGFIRADEFGYHNNSFSNSTKKDIVN